MPSMRYVFSQWDVLTLWPQHLYGCPYRQGCSQPTSCSSETYWYGMEREAFLHSSSKEARAKGEKEGYSKSNRIKGLAKVLYWTSLGATGMVLPNGCRMTLVMVVPHLCCWNGFPPLFFPSPFPFFPFREGIPLKESLPFIPSSPFLPFPFPQKAVSCWSFSHAIPCSIAFSFWPRTEAGSWTFAFPSITLRVSFLEWSAVSPTLIE